MGAALGAFLAILNIQIVGASLADIQGAIGAGADEGGWISTAYLVAEIVVIPLSGWLAQVFSLRRYLLVELRMFGKLRRRHRRHHIGSSRRHRLSRPCGRPILGDDPIANPRQSACCRRHRFRMV